jgi:hypothetical protein
MPLLRDEYEFPARLAESYAASLAPHPEIQQILLHWHDQHHLLEYGKDAHSLYALMRSSQLLPVQAIRCLAAKNPERAVQDMRARITQGAVQVRASGVRIYVNTNDVAVANAPCERNVSGVVEIKQDSNVFEVMGVNRARLPVVMNWVRSRGTERPNVW